MKKWERVLLRILLIAVLCVAGFFGLREWVIYDFDDPEVVCSISPAGAGSALFVWHGAMHGRHLSLVIPRRNGDGDGYVWVGTLYTDDYWNFEGARWSADGKVIGARRREPGDRSESRRYGACAFSHGYDFEAGTLFRPPGISEVSMAMVRHGGEGKEHDEVKTETWRVPWWTWRRMKKIIREGEKTER